MGYSISVRFKNEEEKNNMLTFLDSNHELIEKISETDKMQANHNNRVTSGEHLGYAPKLKNLLGFSGTGIPFYIWSLCAWMAVKSTYRFKNDTICLYYDSEKMLVTFDKNNKQNTLVEATGIPIKPENKDIHSHNYMFETIDYDKKKGIRIL